MYRYSVVDNNRYNRLVALRDPAGRYHVAHCTSDLPSIESVLEGSLPAVGFALLFGADGKVYRLIFSQINCSQLWAMGMLHPEQMVTQPHSSLAANDGRKSGP